MRTMGAKELDYCMDVLELPRTVKNLLDARSDDELRKGLERFKAVVRSHRRKLAKKYHPDKTGGDESRMKAINDAVDFVMGLRVIERRPVRHIIHYGVRSNSVSTTSTTFSFGTGFWES